MTGGDGTGAGDAAPDPSVVLEDDSTRTAVVDNHIILPLDDDGDGILDIGVSPRSAARYAISPEAEGTTASQVFALRIPLEKKLFSPNYRLTRGLSRGARYARLHRERSISR